MTTAVALSGGADSLLSLALTLEKEKSPLAVHAFFLPPDSKAYKTQEAIQALCDKLGVSLYTFDLSTSFKELIIEPFIQTYLQGRTPNPCALCNKKIKFGLLLEKAMQCGATALATGHYARVKDDCRHAPGLYRGLDPAKEQSYFLSLLSREQLKRTFFPLEIWHKEQTYLELQKRGLQVPLAQESQEVCFIPDNDYRTFLIRQKIDLPGPGKIKDSSGKVLGEHQGLWGYTIGQRRGLGIAYSEPLYVLGKNNAQNTLIVGTKKELHSSSCLVKDINCLLPFKEWPETIYVQTIYRQEAKPAQVKANQEGLQVHFRAPRKPASPGQIATFYSSAGRVLGGGIIHD